MASHAASPSHTAHRITWRTAGAIFAAALVALFLTLHYTVWEGEGESVRPACSLTVGQGCP